MGENYNKQIGEMQQELNLLIEENASYEEIYEVSKKLDILINLYLDEEQK